MEVSSPPKRMTRARAAATADSTATTKTKTKTTKAAATKAATTTKPTTTRTAASMKRKTRADEDDDHEESQRQAAGPAAVAAAANADAPKPVRARGRPKKVVEPEPEKELEPEPKKAAAPLAATGGNTAARATRGRPKKTVEEAPKPEPVKTTRTRTRKAQADVEDKTPAAPAPAKKTATRGRAAPAKSTGTICNEPTTNPTPGLKSNFSRPASRIAAATTKKSVTFQEPEKENMVPPLANKAKTKTETEPAATGMRAKPVRKAAAATRATRTSARTATTAEKKEKPAPLSPKKDSQNRPLSRASDSDDELAGYDEPVKPLMKSPVKPPVHRNADVAMTGAHETEEDGEWSDDDDELAGTSVFTSPAKRLPSTPFKDTMKSPAKRSEGAPTLLFPTKVADTEVAQSPFKASALQSPAKRPHAPIPGLQAPSAEPMNQPRSPFKSSLLGSPAKRPMSPIKFSEPVSRSVDVNALESPKPQPLMVDEPVAASPADENDEEQSQAEDDENATSEMPTAEGDHGDVDMLQDEEINLESPVQLEFPGRLSAVLPRYADPALQDKSSPLKALSSAQLQPIHIAEEEESAAVEEQPTEAAEEEEATEPAEEEENVETAEEITETADDEAATEVADDDNMELDQADDENLDASAKDAVQSQDETSDSEQAVLPEPEVANAEEEPVSNDQNGTHSEEDTAPQFAVPATPTPENSKASRSGLPSSAIKNAGRAIRSVTRGNKLSFTPLAKQLGDWRSGSPLKQSTLAASPSNTDGYSLIEDQASTPGQSPAKGTFFEDEMRIRAEMEAGMGSEAEAEMMAAIEADLAASFEEPEEPDYNDIPVTSEDVELAAEANEMSLLEPDEVEEVIEAQAREDTISEASQEYGDENAVPIDPALLNSHGGPTPVTPVRPSAARTFNTTTKVPLKPADDSTPRSMKRRSASASRVPAKRPTGPTRNATVISYSPTKETAEEDLMDEEEDEQDDQPPVTPSKSDIWSSIGTPARTPRQDLNPSLLRGAVVFVDVHTSEGADASTVFVDLLTQMGARCVKSWPWNPAGPAEPESSTSKIGITHVVYKDGGKRTMEKVRESGGVVQCVGVSWVLDCERENEWLDEAPYYIDTSLVPRGGARRRKSMEPKAIANHNGTLVTPMKQAPTARECQTVPNNRMGRRDSTVWMHSPSNPDDEDEEMEDVGDNVWDGSMLTPVPKTPAPEALHRYVSELDVAPETPGADWSNADSPEKNEMLMRTAPPKQTTFADLGQGLLNQNKDQSVLMRLMAARRKSMQYAPKIASPLSKGWKN